MSDAPGGGVVFLSEHGRGRQTPAQLLEILKRDLGTRPARGLFVLVVRDSADGLDLHWYRCGLSELEHLGVLARAFSAAASGED